MSALDDAAPRRPMISVVVPCYGCESCLRALHAELVRAIEPITGDFEIVLVDDRSPHLDWSAIVAIAAGDKRVRGFRLSRNFGQHYAIAAGLAFAEGDWVVVMDCDLQDSPKEIARLLAKAREGYPVVFARRMNRKDSLRKRFSSRAFNFVHSRLSGFKIDATVGTYSMIARRVVLELRNFRERTRNYGMQIGWLGYPIGYVDVEHAQRHSGSTSYTLIRQLRHALHTILSQSTRPLYLSAGVGAFCSITAALYALYLAVLKLTSGISVAGWTSVMVGLFFLSGLMMMMMGVLGLYIGNIFLETKHRPVFVVDETTSKADDALVERATTHA